MNFKITWKFAGKLVLALIVGALLGTWMNNELGTYLALMPALAVIIMESQRQY